MAADDWRDDVVVTVDHTMHLDSRMTVDGRHVVVADVAMCPARRIVEGTNDHEWCVRHRGHWGPCWPMFGDLAAKLRGALVFVESTTVPLLDD